MIITNAKKNWVYVSAKKLLPLTSVILEQGEIPVISARENHESEFPDEPQKWKMNAFQKLPQNPESKLRFDHDLVTNLIVMGDQDFEIEAGLKLSQQIEKCLYKSIKLSQSPSQAELIKQLNIVSKKWEYIWNSMKNLEVELTRRKKDRLSNDMYTSFNNQGSAFPQVSMGRMF